MERKLPISIVLLFGIVSSVFAAKPTPEAQQQAMQTLVTLLAGKHYLINTDQATGMSGAANATAGAVKIDGEIIKSTLPYWGNGYNTYGNDSFLYFNGKIDSYRVEPGKKNKLYVYINATEPRGKKYAFKVEVFYNGIIFMSVNGTSLQPMRYSGAISEIPKKPSEEFQLQQSPDLFPLQ